MKAMMKKYLTPQICTNESISAVPAVAAIGLAEAASLAASAVGFFGATRLVRALRGADLGERQEYALQAVHK